MDERKRLRAEDRESGKRNISIPAPVNENKPALESNDSPTTLSGLKLKSQLEGQGLAFPTEDIGLSRPNGMF